MTKVFIKALKQCLLVLCVIILLPITIYGQTNYINSSVPILLYHHIAEENPNNNEYIISPDNFYEHVLFLKNSGYECISLNDYYNYRNGLGVLPEKPIIITFDDGYYSNYQYAYPILKSLNAKATIFICTAFAEDDSLAEFPHFSWEQAKEMQESGIIDIQSHSHNHKSFFQLDKSEIIQELTLSKELIEKHLNKECNYFAYPNGMYNSQIQSLTKNAGYLMQLTTNSGYNTDEQNLDELNRITVLNNTSAKMLSEILLPYRLEFTDINKSINGNQVSFKIDFNIINNIKIPCDSVVMLAIYDDKNRLIHLKNLDVFVENYGFAGGFSNITFSKNSDSYSIKLLCIDNFENLFPYAPKISQPIK